MSPLPPDLIPLGFVARAHGIKGALLVKLFHPDGDSLRPGLHIVLTNRHCERSEAIQSIENNRLFLTGIHTRTEAEKLAGFQIWVQRSDFSELEVDEVYLVDLIGFEALTPAGKHLGEVTGFSDNRAQLLVQIGDVLIPFVKPILVKIDEENRQIILDLPEGYEL